MANKQKSGGGSRKKGRSKKRCEVYRALGRRELNKVNRVERYYRRSIKHIEKRLGKIDAGHKDRPRLEKSLRRLTLEFKRAA